MTRAPKQRPWWHKAILGLGVATLLLVVALGLVELALRAAGFACAPSPRNYFEMDLYNSAHRMDPDLFWTLRPNHRAWQVGAAGFRDPSTTPVPKHKPAREFRIVFLGDSVVFGWGKGGNEAVLDATDTFVYGVQQRLNAIPHRKVTYRCLNFGVPGHTTHQGEALLRTRALAYHPDLVLAYFGANDFSGSTLSDAQRAQIFPLHMLLHRLRVVRLVGCMIRPSWGEAGPPSSALAMPNGTQRVSDHAYLQNLQRMERDARSVGGRFAVLAYLYYAAPAPGAPAGARGTLSAEDDLPYPPGMVVIDLRPAMRKALAPSRVPMYFDSCHPTRAGHAIMAENIVSELRHRALVPDLVP